MTGGKWLDFTAGVRQEDGKQLHPENRFMN
jgi:hypothetical protein